MALQKTVTKVKTLFIRVCMKIYLNKTFSNSQKKFLKYVFCHLERGRRSQQYDSRSNRYPPRGSKHPPPNNHYKSHHYNPQRHLVRSAPPIRQIGYDSQPLTYKDSRDVRSYPTKSPIPFTDRRSNEPYNISSSRSMDDIRGRNASIQESPIKKRLTASEEKLTDLHKQWEMGTKFHVVIRVRPMTVREIKESAKVWNIQL